MDNNRSDTPKYRVEYNSKYSTASKQGSGNGNNTKQTIIDVLKQQSSNSNKK